MEGEGHPIPQDITGFQFRLIGDMTIKQFAYLAAGAVLAWIFFSIPGPGIIKIPLAGLFLMTGLILAFMPIHGRPSDVMLMLFFKAIFKPNQFTYKKISNASTPPIADTSQQLAQPQTTISSAIPLIQTSEPAITPSPTPIAQTPVPPSPTLSIPITPPAPENVMLDSFQHPDGINPITTNPIIPTSQYPKEALPQEPTLPNNLPVIPLDAVNLVAGVVEDPRGNVIQNIIVEVKDADGNPVRTFKTNASGQFIAATPLTNGTYSVSFEDPDKRHQFTSLTLIAKGEPLTPIEIKSMDQREQLRQSLFTPKEVPPVQQS